MQEGEKDLKTSIHREIEEETGLVIKIGKPIATWTWQIKAEPHPVFLVGYDCKYISGEVKLSSEHSEFHWVTKNNYKDVTEKYKEENPEISEALDEYFGR